MSTRPRLIAFTLGCLLAAVGVFARAAEPPTGGTEVFYYRFEEKVYGRLDTSILAVQLAPETAPREAPAAGAATPPSAQPLGIEMLPQVELPSARPLGEELPYVRAFRQERILFLALDEELDTAGLLDLAGRLSAVSPAARVGHPLFLEGAELPVIVTDEIIVRFLEGVSEERIAAFHEEQKVEVISRNPHVGRQYLLRVTGEGGLSTLETANRYQESGLVEFAHPNFLVHIEFTHTPTDTDYADQWHLENTGSGAMTADADIDADKAWDITLGDPDIVVAVLDGGFEITHPDLTNQIEVNAAEAPNGLDDDGNGYVDDINGWSFDGNSGDVSVGLWPYHGQSVAGLVAAEENGGGVVGVCPECRLVPISISFAINDLADAFYYARDRGADIITNSWGATDSTFDQPALNAAIADVANTLGGGIPIFFATGNDGGSTVAYPARDPNTIAVGGSDCTDTRYADSQYGAEINVVAPTRQSDNSCGLVTTDLGGATGSSFGGTSGATPIAAGIAGLLLSADPNLTRQEVQLALQDTADKTEPSVADYETGFGFSDPATPTHGWGRVNAFEALRLVAPAADGGRAGKDVFLRDNRFDWGNTDQPSNVLMDPTRGTIAHWVSVDIKVDAPPYQPAPTTAADFEAFTDEDPVSGVDNRVYVRVHNRGSETVSDLEVSLHWTFAGTALPTLPADFWTAPPGTSSNADWHSLGVQPIEDLEYSGASTGQCPGRPSPVCGVLVDDSKIVQFTFPGPPLDPMLPLFRHHCVLAVLHTGEDPVTVTGSLVPDYVTPRDNNVTHRNLFVQDYYASYRFAESFLVRNPTAGRITTILELDLPRSWDAEKVGRWSVEGVALGQPFEMDAGEEILVTLRGRVPQSETPAEVVVRQRTVASAVPFDGGITFRFRPQPQPATRGRAWSLHLGTADPRGTLAAVFDGDLAATVDLEFSIRPNLAWDLRLGLARFDGRGQPLDLDVWDLSANLKRYWPTAGGWRPFVNAGLGLYLLDPGDLEGGYNAGLGLSRRLDPMTRLEAVVNYHGTFTASPDIEYLKLQLGLLRSF